MKKIKNIILNSSLNEIAVIENYIEDLKINKAIKEEVFGNIVIALNEAVSNAISHGNKCDSNKNVIFETYEQKDKLTFRVSDEGNGFDPDSVPDPTQPQFLGQENGRGVFLMRTLADKVTFCNRGNVEGTMVEIDFNIN
ncbi:MAG: ATP-binding protein [Bacteroidetes bacterium]|mgnify:FL=1|jgi:serine/threonine-protein kinase RsbW|nr:ATP-binding protein [Bacteroidota bacterium]MBK7504529.1 ATP-binding protein [Bacteroidota bacterium]MBK8673620.1 ATP-binding protein [Bacteroidota bacterium]MBK9354265.1 ATP-binding protein [Bacteroidota bacterium]MBL0286268.1 ATP-binding protein [Bacteroidota bacterium]